jgi:exopolysaccharide biosynthesis polyprenyl glycosylphosphotransferase
VSVTERTSAEGAPALALGELAPGRPAPVVAGRRRRGWLVRRTLLVADVAGLTLAFLLGQALWGEGAGPANRLGATGELTAFLVTLPGWIVVAKLYGLYDRDEERTDHSTVDDLGSVFHLVTTGAWLFFLGSSLTGLADPNLVKVATFWAAAILLVVCGRLAARAICRRHPSYLQRTLIVGAGEVGQLIARKLATHDEYGIELVGFVDAEPRERRPDLGDLHLVGSLEDLLDVVRMHDVERVVFAFSNEPHDRELAAIRELKTEDVQIDVVPRLFELVSPGIGVHTVEGLPLVGLPPTRLPRSSALLKRALDITLAALGCLVLAPLFAVLAVAIKADSRGPVFFRQIRMGSGGRMFALLKFRTMVADADERKHEFAHLNKHAGAGGDPRMFKIENDPRVTRVGRLLRSCYLDELPQLLNVLRGEMSLVGPRPLILEEDEHVLEWGRRRLDHPPGMTGLWQVLGGSKIPFEEMVRLDYLYVSTWSLANDLRILLKTFAVVLRRTGAAH